MTLTQKTFLKGLLIAKKIGLTGKTNMAVAALTAKGFETKPGYCQRWTRQWIQKIYGAKFDKYFDDTARKTGLLFKDSRYSVPLHDGPLPGDVLYYIDGHGPDGHVVTLLERGLVAENSVVHGPSGDGRGFRTLRELGPPDVIVRLS